MTVQSEIPINERLRTEYLNSPEFREYSSCSALAPWGYVAWLEKELLAERLVRQKLAEIMDHDLK